ncbi:JmjC domain-containing protein [Hoeflea ulvae]|uniref:Cupin domain-containing protein n=1 Tax=Hoeflea ulvae TaxID=2983764 RepID=A0ABT3YKI7_9HYPH|nr:cupin domain-containing protein [Hoeflea ulvae]MCY0096410.1 cupin domain-containing protein [Hoeflea ulvae]
MSSRPTDPAVAAQWSLEKLIAPVSAEDFFSTYLERDFLHATPRTGRSLATLFQLGDLEKLISQMQDPDAVRTTGGRGGNKDGPNPSARGGTRMGSLYADYSRGKTIVVNGIHQSWEPVRDLCAALTSDLAMALQCNLYVTPAHAQGLDCHWDGHDVLILQVDGSKDWTLYPMIDTLSAPDDEGKSVSPTAAPLMQLTLRAGDVLYMPRGMPHVARATDETSAHLTIGLIGVTWRDLMQAAVHVAAETRQDMRRVLPPDWLSKGIAGPSLPMAYRQAIAVLADEDVLRRALDLVAAKVISQCARPVQQSVSVARSCGCDHPRHPGDAAIGKSGPLRDRRRGRHPAFSGRTDHQFGQGPVGVRFLCRNA